ncbi:MAG: hypothetical protein IKU36_04950 [Bacteroidales bacterium]|nr:hypothetical protein [Bacteroidales bacterium]
MKHLLLIKTLLLTLFIASQTDCFAQQATDVQGTMNMIVKKHEASEGVNCLTVAKGSGLELVKMMFNKEFGKEFMKGIKSITIIEYTDASEETCMVLRKDLDTFLDLLQEFDLSQEEQFANNDFLRCFASASDTSTISDFVIAIEDAEAKMLMYMAGNIRIDSL